MSKNDFLTEEQMGVLQSVDLGSDIVVDVNYYKKNAATDASEVNTMHSVLTVIPELEAEFPGGHTEMRQYLHDHAISKISEAKSKKLKDVVIKFTVDENGEVADARITQSSDDHAIDSLLLKAIHKMPKWKPAENAGGLKVRQDFEFRVGTMGC
jgi:TonB family protein